MPDDQPSSASDAVQPHDQETAARVLRDDDAGKGPGGGGLGSPAVAATDPLAGRTVGGTAPGSPIDVAVPNDAARSDALAEAESRQLAGADAPEPRPTSQ